MLAILTNIMMGEYGDARSLLDEKYAEPTLGSANTIVEILNEQCPPQVAFAYELGTGWVYTEDSYAPSDTSLEIHPSLFEVEPDLGYDGVEPCLMQILAMYYDNAGVEPMIRCSQLAEEYRDELINLTKLQVH
ncbi:hypothetical protein N9937_00165 [bacterium]|nr:hypothetical protein [bacterium]